MSTAPTVYSGLMDPQDQFDPAYFQAQQSGSGFEAGGQVDLGTDVLFQDHKGNIHPVPLEQLSDDDLQDPELQALLQHADEAQQETGLSPEHHQIISDAADALQGKHSDPGPALQNFIDNFGHDEYQGFRSAVLGHGQHEGLIDGDTPGMADLVQADNPSADVKVSHGEYIVPADAVAALGDGNTDAGSRALDETISKLRQLKYGRDKQPPPVKDGFLAKALGVK